MSDRPRQIDRLGVVYELAGPEPAALALARALCVEQTVEFPADLLPAGFIPERVVGRIEGARELPTGRFQITLGYAPEVATGELTQLLNVIFGNASLLPGVRVARLELCDEVLAHYRGPRFGRAGLRALCGAPHRPLLCTALKPMGLSPEALAELAHELALGGIDLIKDDHGLADQPFCPFQARVRCCARAVARANAETGGCSLYLPNVSAPADRIWSRARFAKAAGAGGLLLAPGLVGWDTMRAIADDDSIALPILGHPALLGSFLTQPDQGLAHPVLFGDLHRLAGADACIFPNHGGRFAFSAADCRALAEATGAPIGGRSGGRRLAPIFPVPAGGMTLDRVPEMIELYGSELIVLIGGALHRGEGGLVESCRRLRALVEQRGSAPTRKRGNPLTNQGVSSGAAGDRTPDL